MTDQDDANKYYGKTLIIDGPVTFIHEDEDLKITPLPLPFNENDKIFNYCDEEGNIIGEPYSYNDFIDKFSCFSGVNEELLGRGKAR